VKRVIIIIIVIVKNMPNLRNFEDILRGLYTLLSTDKGAISHEVITFSTPGVYSLTVPQQARYALCVLEEVGASGDSKVIRYWLDGSDPSTTVGIPRGDLDAFDIAGYANLKDFKAIKVSGGNHTLTVQYFS
jgi:hypothetical protein